MRLKHTYYCILCLFLCLDLSLFSIAADLKINFVQIKIKIVNNDSALSTMYLLGIFIKNLNRSSAVLDVFSLVGITLNDNLFTLL